MKIIKASYPSTKMPIHTQWALVCKVKHFQSKQNAEFLRLLMHFAKGNLAKINQLEH
jgi:hypothetical protein